MLFRKKTEESKFFTTLLPSIFITSFHTPPLQAPSTVSFTKEHFFLPLPNIAITADLNEREDVMPTTGFRLDQCMAVSEKDSRTKFENGHGLNFPVWAYPVVW